MKLPNVERAVIAEAKITRYLLNLESENGQAKARFFLAFGFTIDSWQAMADALKDHARTYDLARAEAHPPFGVHYVVEGRLNSPDGRNPATRVIWIIDAGDEVPRFVSAYPL